MKKNAIIAVGGVSCAVIVCCLWFFRTEAVLAYKYKRSESSKVVEGRDGWLFYRASLAYLLKPWADNVHKIVMFDRQLKNAGIDLIVVPVPNKVEVYPDYLAKGLSKTTRNKRRETFLRSLQDSGVEFVDLLPAFRRARMSVDLFDSLDTHWTSTARMLAARIISERMSEFVVGEQSLHCRRDTVVRINGDLYRLHFGSDPHYTRTERIVTNTTGNYYKDSKESSIVIFGDSFANVGRNYSAHLGAYIAQHLGRPVETLHLYNANSNGPFAFEGKEEYLHGKKVLVWVFTSRVLRLPLGSKKTG